MSGFVDRAEFKVNWRPFQLNPSAPMQGENKLEMYNSKFGEDRVRQIVPRLTKVFAEHGLEYSLGGMTGNTLNSHRLVAAAQSHGVADAMVEELMRAYFCEEKFLNDRDVLLTAARNAGLPDAEAVVDDETAFLSEVKKDLKEYAAGVRGVPYFIINGRHGLSGAQEPEVFEGIFSEILDQT